MTIPMKTTTTATLVANQYNLSAAAAAATSGAQSAAPEGFASLSPEGLLFFCQKQLQDLDTKIRQRMADQQSLTGLQDQLGSVATMIRSCTTGGKEGAQFDDDNAIKGMEAKIGEVIKMAEKAGQPDVVKMLESVRTQLRAGDGGEDTLVSADDIKSMCTSIEDSQSSLRSTAEMNMIEMQALVAKRSTALQLTTGMMNSINEGMKSIAGNIGR